MSLNSHFYFLLFLVLLIACRKDPVSTDEIQYIETAVKGIVSDESGIPIQEATVSLGEELTLTDQNGYFSINGKVNATQPFIRIEKSGYFPSICNFIGKSDNAGRVKAILRTKNLSSQIHSSNGGIVQIQGGGSISLKAWAFVNASGEAYEGLVNVYATLLDPTKPETIQMIPGSFLGINQEGRNEVLQSFGMINVLLESPAGEKLQISKPATVRVPIPADILQFAPDNIPLWYLDEKTSVWTKKGNALNQDDLYVGEVSHFSWWNFDVGFPSVILNGRISLEETYPFITVKITLNNGLSVTCTPDETGFFSGFVPSNETFKLEIINECGTAIDTRSLGPFSADTDLGLIQLSAGTVWTKISGTLINCDGDPVSNGLLFVNSSANSPNRFPIQVTSENGSFSGIVPACGPEIILTAYDFNSGFLSQPITMAAETELDFGNISVCKTEIPLGVTIEYGDQTRFLSQDSVRYSATQWSEVYKIFVTDNQDGYLIHYEFRLEGEKLSPSPRVWYFSFDRRLVPIPAHYTYYFSFDSYKINVLEAGGRIDEFIIAEISDFTLITGPDGNQYPNSKFKILARLR